MLNPHYNSPNRVSGPQTRRGGRLSPPSSPDGLCVFQDFQQLHHLGYIQIEGENFCRSGHIVISRPLREVLRSQRLRATLVEGEAVRCRHSVGAQGEQPASAPGIHLATNNH